MGTPGYQHTSHGKNPNPAGKGHHTPWTVCFPCHSRQTLASTSALNWKVILNLSQYLPVGTVLNPGLSLHSQGHSKEQVPLGWQQQGAASAALLCNQHQLLCCQRPAGSRATLHWGPGQGERRLLRAPALLTATAGRCGAPCVSNRDSGLCCRATRAHKSHSCFSRRWELDCQMSEHLT